MTVTIPTKSRRFAYDRIDYQQFRQALTELDITHPYFARISGKNPRKVQEWFNGQEDIPHEVTLILALLTLPGALQMASEITNSRIRVWGEGKSDE